VGEGRWEPIGGTRPWPGRHEVHVFSAWLDLPDERREALAERLSAEERARAARFVFVRDRHHFLAARGLLRVILASYLDRAPEELSFHYGAYGKPALAAAGPGADLRFNVSHSHGLALFAIADGREVGVDVERIEAKADLQRLAEGFFAAREVEALRSLCPSEQPRAFFACWTRKEAFIKATGEGLSRPLDGFDVSVAPDDDAPALCIGSGSEETGRWSLRDLRPASGFAAALAVSGPVECVSCREWATDPGDAEMPRLHRDRKQAWEVR
jgi:4'-phosphopantetheinyl transferase